ncbi:MAG: sensor histidine kinase, partial [Stackebrandtia sp.]
DPAPVETLDESVAELVSRAAEAGMRANLTGCELPERLPPLVERAVHRVVREALTNAARYAPGAPVTVHIDVPDDRLRVAVFNGLTSSAPLLPGGGGGLAGLTERVRLAGGELRAGPLEAGFEVVARLPIKEAA